jgi:ankyrin repeat protein
MDAARMNAAILQAIKDGDEQAVQRLLRDDPALVHASDEVYNKTPLHWAAELDRQDIGRMLIDAGADLEARTSWGATPLAWAGTMGSIRVADLLLARGAKGMNLATAASLGKLDLVRAFLVEGVERDVISQAFYGACRNGHTAVAALLLERGADVNAKGFFGGTGLHWAAINGHEDTIEFLVAHGADLTLRDAQFHSTPEGWAAEGRHEKIRQFLAR